MRAPVDPTTGLPELPKGYAWRVEPAEVLRSDWGTPVYGVIGGKDAYLVDVWLLDQTPPGNPAAPIVVARSSRSGARIKPTRRSIRRGARIALRQYERAKRSAVGVAERNRLLGEYPPKRLA